MAQTESDKEDLFEEAKGLIPRIELWKEGKTTVIGIGKKDTVSFYFGQDFMLRFDAADHLRRGFDSGLLFRAERGQKMSVITRQRTQTESHLLSRLLSEVEEQAFIAKASTVVLELHRAFENKQWKVLRWEGGSAADLISQFQSLTARIAALPIRIADGMK